MKLFQGKKLVLAFLIVLLNAGLAAADPSSMDWNDSWGFPTPAEKANTLAQAIEMEFVEEGGFNQQFNQNYWGSTNCEIEAACVDWNGDTIAIGNQVVIDGDNNSVDASNEGNVSAQNNNGAGSIDQDFNDSNNGEY